MCYPLQLDAAGVEAQVNYLIFLASCCCGVLVHALTYFQHFFADYNTIITTCLKHLVLVSCRRELSQSYQLDLQIAIVLVNQFACAHLSISVEYSFSRLLLCQDTQLQITNYVYLIARLYSAVELLDIYLVALRLCPQINYVFCTIMQQSINKQHVGSSPLASRREASYTLQASNLVFTLPLRAFSNQALSNSVGKQVEEIMLRPTSIQEHKGSCCAPSSKHSLIAMLCSQRNYSIQRLPTLIPLSMKQQLLRRLTYTSSVADAGLSIIRLCLS